MSKRGADLAGPVYDLYYLVESLDSLEQLDSMRDDVRRLVHRLNEAYLNWAFDVDNAQLTVVE